MGFPDTLYFKVEHYSQYSFTEKIGVLKGWIFPHFFFKLSHSDQFVTAEPELRMHCLPADNPQTTTPPWGATLHQGKVGQQECKS